MFLVQGGAVPLRAKNEIPLRHQQLKRNLLYYPWQQKWQSGYGKMVTNLERYGASNVDEIEEPICASLV